MTDFSFHVEILENRIAPAVLFLTQDFVLKDGANHVIAPDSVDAGIAGAKTAFLLKGGDSVVLDLNGNHKLDKGEATLMKVVDAKALVFLTDLNSNATFDAANEITGLAVSHGFRGIVNVGINGSVVTALGKTGGFQSTALQDASIVSLAVAGAVSGDIAAGRSISNLAIGFGDSTSLSVRQILSGTSASGDVVSYNGGATTITLDDFSNTTGVGGSVTNAKLAKGVLSAAAGDGAPGFAGGDIKNLAIATQGANNLTLTSGTGGDSETSNGGDGGKISTIVVGAMQGSLQITAGDGAFGGGIGAGGDGGSITGVTATLSASSSATLSAGAGSEAGYTEVDAVYNSNGDLVRDSWIRGGAGGAGGSVSGVALVTLGDIVSLEITSGDGGVGHGAKAGGAGGSISLVGQTGSGGIGAATLSAGAGGATADTGNGAAGGNISGIQLPKIIGSLTLQAGDGSDGQFAGFGGAGGSISKVNGAVSVATAVTVAAGNGGSGGSFDVEGVYNGNGDEIRPGYTSGGAGGDGGSIANLTLAVIGDGSTAVSIAAGNGGVGNGAKSGGSGGGINASSVSVDAIDNVLIQAGSGAVGGTHFGIGGTGGNIGAFTFISTAAIANEASISAGNAGNAPGAEDSAPADGDQIGAAGGSISNLTLKTQAPQLDVIAGAGGLGIGGKNGGKGGAIAGVQGTAGVVSFIAGAGGSADTSSDGGGAGAEGGSVTNLVLSADGLTIESGDGGDSSGALAGGKGGAIAKLNAQIGVGAVQLTSGAGGAAGKISFEPVFSSDGETLVRDGFTKGAVGGVGGAISEITLNAEGQADQVFGFTAGNGGTGTGLKAGGAGGAVSGVKVNVAHQIQDFAIHAGKGGDGDPDDDGSVGGIGGAISKINLNVVETINALAELLAGDGGAGNGKPGIGGSIATVTLNAANAFTNAITAGAGGDGDPVNDGTVFADVTVNGVAV